MVKKIFLSFLILLMLAPLLFAQVRRVTPNELTIAWNEVTTDIGGDTITGVLYEVYILQNGADKTDESLWILSTVTSQTSATISFAGLPTGEYLLGVRSMYNVGETTLYSEMNWSDVNGEMTPDPFVIVYAKPPVTPEGLRIP